MTLILTNEEVREAVDATGYIEAMEEAFRELGQSAAINSPRTETSIPLSRYTASLRSEVRALMREIPLDADPIHSPEALKAGKKAKEVIYRFNHVFITIPGISSVKQLKGRNIAVSRYSLNKIKGGTFYASD